MNHGNETAKDEAMAPLGLPTPPKVRALQRTLYRKAKEDPRWRAWSLYGEVCRRDVLECAAQAVIRNAGAAGEDGVTTAQVKACQSETLDALQRRLKDRSYKPGPVKRVWIAKDDGKLRALGVPNVIDRTLANGPAAPAAADLRD